MTLTVEPDFVESGLGFCAVTRTHVAMEGVKKIKECTNDF
jgi:hypothetical protein